MKKIALTLACLSFVFSAYSAQLPKIDLKPSESQKDAQAIRITEALGLDADRSANDSTKIDRIKKMEAMFAEIEDASEDDDPYTVAREMSGMRNRRRTDPEYQALARLGAAAAPNAAAVLAPATPLGRADELGRRVIAAVISDPHADRQGMRDSFLAGVTQNFPAAGAIAPNGGHAVNDAVVLRAGQDFGNYLTAAHATQGVPVADLLRFLENTLRSIG